MRRWSSGITALSRPVLMGVTSALRSELKRRVLPLAEARGFVVDERKLPQSIEFRRTAGDAVHVFGIQWEKYGKPRFAVHYGTCPAAGLRVGPDLFPPRDVLVSWLADAGSLQPRRGSSSRAWFRQDRSFISRLIGRPRLRTPGEVVDELLTVLPELQRYWDTGSVGPHMRTWR